MRCSSRRASCELDEALGREKLALSMRQEVYSGRARLSGEGHEETLEPTITRTSLVTLRRCAEAKSIA